MTEKTKELKNRSSVLPFFCFLVLLFVSAVSVAAQGELIIESFPTPNDPLYLRQASAFEQINLPEAWAQTTGSSQVIIAVIDSGVDTDHPDIIGNMWFNPGEIPLNGVDDDGNGFVDDLNGWDFLENTSDPHPKFSGSYTFAGLSHGTAVAGLAAASTNNAEGIAGVCWQCKIMALRAVASDGRGETGDVARAIQYAVDNGADIINMSFVGERADKILNAAVKSAYEAGVVLVAAVGNEADEIFLLGGDLDLWPLYPVCFDGARNAIIGVGSVDRNNRKSSFSNYGFRCIDINAPGNGLIASQLYEPARGEEYKQKYYDGWRGTSVAAPIVAGAAGLIKSINPRLTAEQITAIVRATGRDLTAVNPFYFGQLGAGLLDIDAALTLARETPGLGTNDNRRRRQLLVSKPIKITPASGRRLETVVTNNLGQEKARWLSFPEFFRGSASVASGDVDGDGEEEVVVGAGAGGGPQLRIFSAAGELKGQFFVHDLSYRQGLAVAVADIDADGVAEIITALGLPGRYLVKVFDYSGQARASLSIERQDFKGLPSLAVGNVDGDGALEFVLGNGPGSLPEVQIFDNLGKRKTFWFAYSRSFRGGVRVAVGDVDGDGVAEVVTAPLSGGPHIRIFTAAGALQNQFFAFEKEFRGGASVALGNADDDPATEIIVGAGAGRQAEVRLFSKFGADFKEESAFPVFEKGYKGGVNVGI